MLRALARLCRPYLVGASALAMGSILLLGRPAAAKEFPFDEQQNAEIARKLRIPVYFAVPGSARMALPASIDFAPPDRTVDFKHPDARKLDGDVGLRIVVMRRAGMAQRLFKSGLVQTGDVLLSVRPEWGGAGPYPNVQMGISHTGMAYLKDGAVRNIDNPLDQDYLGPGYRADLTSAHYSELKVLHIVRPRSLTDEQRSNLEAWATRFNAQARRIYPSQVSFNSDYNAPKYQSGKPLSFVQHVAQSGLGLGPRGSVSMFCSEFVWSLLSLRKCDPDRADAFRSNSVASCVEPVMQPMRVTGDYVGRHRRGSNAGLADRPLIVVEAMKMRDSDRDKLLWSIFQESPGGLGRMSQGHRKLATDMKSKFGPLENYYRASFGLWGPEMEARMIGYGFNKAIPDNYSPTSFLINTLLEPNNRNRAMDYVATILIE